MLLLKDRGKAACRERELQNKINESYFFVNEMLRNVGKM